MSEFSPGVPVAVAENVLRVVAPNAGPMTGPGTNTYVLGEQGSVVIDPGPESAAHVDNILQATGGIVNYVLVTHTHRDHSPAAMQLCAQTGAQSVGMAPPQPPYQDTSFQPDYVPADGELLQLDDVVLRVVHTPGHASNHLCYLLERQQMLFTGDHVMQGSTVVIPPPDGDMAAYMSSLEKVQALSLSSIAPGHGAVMDDPQRALRRLLRHRRQREARILNRLGQTGAVTVPQLLEQVYDDVPQQFWPVARLSLKAHLLKLLAEGRVTQQQDLWRLAG